MPYGVQGPSSQVENGTKNAGMCHMMDQNLVEEGKIQDSYGGHSSLPRKRIIHKRNELEKAKMIGIRQAVDETSRIHILGTGSLGKFIAYALAGNTNPPPITLLSHVEELSRSWDTEGRGLGLVTGKTSHRRSGIDFRQITTLESQANNSKYVLESLVLAVRENAIIPALMRIRKHLGAASTICFLQDGMGIVDDVNKRLFPNPATRPRYIIGASNHYISNQPSTVFTTIQTREGRVYLAVVPENTRLSNLKGVVGDRQINEKSLTQRMYYGWNNSSRNLMRNLTRCNSLRAVGVPYEEMLQKQLWWLAVNATLNSLSVVFDSTHKELLKSPRARGLIRGLVEEIIAVVHAIPELQNSNSEPFKSNFMWPKLETLIVRLALSEPPPGPMAELFRLRRATNIGYTNGFITQRGKELGIPCPVNTIITDIVKVKKSMAQTRMRSYIPGTGSDDPYIAGLGRFR